MNRDPRRLCIIWQMPNEDLITALKQLNEEVFRQEEGEVVGVEGEIGEEEMESENKEVEKKGVVEDAPGDTSLGTADTSLDSLLATSTYVC